MQTSMKKGLTLGIVTAVVFILDQLSKLWVDRHLLVGQSMPIIKDWLSFTYVRNNGIVFGLFIDRPIVFWIVSLLGVGVIVYIISYIYSNIHRFNLLKIISYGFIGGGALGNSYDRFINGYVIDFIDFNGIWSFIFNCADMFINIAIFLLLVDSYLKKE